MTTTAASRKASDLKGGDFILIGGVAREVFDTRSATYDSTLVRYLDGRGEVRLMQVRDNADVAVAL